ncbi:MAG: SDR family oxidoreductase [Armatimonadota bacterium]
MMGEGKLILLTGATGYVGGLLLPRLVGAGYRVRCLTRHPEALRDAVPPGVEVVQGDVLDDASLPPAMAGVWAAYYLVHSLEAGAEFAEKDRRGAENFGWVAQQAGVQRIIYLGGLANPDAATSAHLRSRLEVGEILRQSAVPVIEFRASIIIGPGSFSFEMIRALVERLPVMITPRWVRIPAQPISIDDVLRYLLAALTLSTDTSEIFEIGGADLVSYGDIMREYARQRGLHRLIIPVPVLTPWLSSRWLGLVTPLQAKVGRQLIDGIRSTTVVHDARALRAFPIQPMGIREAIATALEADDRQWQERLRTGNFAVGKRPAPRPGGLAGTRYVDSRTIHVDAPPDAAFAPIREIGGQDGYYYANWLWRLRALLDALVGGVGIGRTRRHPVELAHGDVIDWWRVELFEPDHRLLLVAEMKVPGRAWLDFTVDPENGGSRLRQTAVFDPRGLFGILYWWMLHPIHQVVFAGMLRAIAERSKREET